MSLQIANLSKRYGTQQVLSDLSFTVEKGQIVGFLGPNGAGKSTTMKIAMGFCKPDAGHVLVDGMDAQKDYLAVQRLVGYLPEHNPLYLDMYVDSSCDGIITDQIEMAERVQETLDNRTDMKLLQDRLADIWE